MSKARDLEDLETGIARRITEAAAATQAAVAESLAAIRLRGARAVPVAAGAPQVAYAAGTVVGWSLRETGGAVALLYLRDGRAATGDLLAVIALSAGESTRDWLGDSGVHFGDGLFLQIAAGAVEGAIYLRGPA